MYSHKYEDTGIPELTKKEAQFLKLFIGHLKKQIKKAKGILLEEISETGISDISLIVTSNLIGVVFDSVDKVLDSYQFLEVPDGDLS